MKTLEIFLLNEENGETENENTENTELYNSDSVSNNANDNACTEVYNPITYELTCAEYLVQTEEEEKTEEEIQAEEEEKEYKEGIKEDIHMIRENQETILSLDVSQNAIELQEELNDYVETIKTYTETFFGVILIVIMFIVLNYIRINGRH